MAPPKALILAPNDADSERISRLLKEHAFDVTTMDDKDLALEELWHGEVRELAFIDIDGGPEVAQTLVDMRIPTMIVGVNHVDLDDEKYKAVGVDHTLVKSFRNDEFRKVLENEGLLNMNTPQPSLRPSISRLLPGKWRLCAARGINELSTLTSFDQECDLQIVKEQKKVLVLADKKVDEGLSAVLQNRIFLVTHMNDHEEALKKCSAGEWFYTIFLDIENGPVVAKSLKEMQIKLTIVGIVANVEELDTVGTEYQDAGLKIILARPLDEVSIKLALHI